ncbi:MAG TPA: PqqD family protein, partial [Solirubrobacteraceae bacterium]
MTAPISFEQRLEFAPDVATSDLHGELVLLNFATETYYGLDEVGARMVTVLTEKPSIERGVEALRDEFDVEEAQLREDVNRLIGELLDGGLV